MACDSVALYGNVAIPRGKCPECGCTSLVIDGVRQCCLSEATGFAPDHFEQIVPPEHVRKPLSSGQKRSIEESQDGRCLYCGKAFGSIVHRNGRPSILRVHFDHADPWVYSFNNSAENMVAACHVCNGIKSSTIYPSLVAAAQDLERRRKSRGWDF
jgi:hypothetical protein